jgi:MFS family permease
MTGSQTSTSVPTASTGAVLFTLSMGQFVMALDSSVMNVSIATVADDLGTSVTGIQSAITLYTLVMASLMITGGKVGQLIGRKRAFAIGCLIYGAGSATTAVAPNLTVLLLGWSVLEGVGAALIMPAIVALVASNFERSERPRAYGLVAASGAIAVALGPLIGGVLTTYASWRWVFAGEVLIVAGIVLLARRMADVPADRGAKLDVVGTVLSASGLGLVVFGILRAGTWGLVRPKPDAPVWLGLSPVVWLVIGGGLVLLAFFEWEGRQHEAGRPVLIDPGLLDSRALRGGLSSFFFQYLLQSGLFFVVPLFLSVALGLTAVETGVRILPLSVALLVTAVGVPKVLPHASPRRVVRTGFVLLFVGTVTLLVALDIGVDAEVVTVPLLLAGLGIGALASQLGSVTVSSVPDDKSAEVGGLQNSVSFLGSSIGTAVTGALLISALSTSFLSGIESNPDVPDQVVAQANVQLGGGVPFISDAQLTEALAATDLDQKTADAIVAENESSRLAGLRAALAALAVLALLALVASRSIPTRQPGEEVRPGEGEAGAT